MNTLGTTEVVSIFNRDPFACKTNRLTLHRKPTLWSTADLHHVHCISPHHAEGCHSHQSLQKQPPLSDSQQLPRRWIYCLSASLSGVGISTPVRGGVAALAAVGDILVCGASILARRRGWTLSRRSSEEKGISAPGTCLSCCTITMRAFISFAWPVSHRFACRNISKAASTVFGEIVLVLLAGAFFAGVYWSRRSHREQCRHLPCLLAPWVYAWWSC